MTLPDTIPPMGEQSRLEAFWAVKRLEELTPEEWELLCDGCGRCCLHKLQDEETDEVFYTQVACRFLDLENCRCREYAQRQQWVPDCVVLGAGSSAALRWMPSTCAYRLLAEGKPLPPWHPLVAGHTDPMRDAGMLASAFAIPEDAVDDPDDLEDYIIPWP